MALRRIVAVLVVLAAFVACGNDDDTAGTDAAPSDDAAAVEDTLTETVAAIGDADAEGFLAHVTDGAVETFGWGTREEVLDGSGGFGQEEISGVEVSDVEVDGDTATAVGDVGVGHGVFRLGFDFVREGDGWLIDSMEFVGTPPLGPDQKVLEITAGDFAFTFDRSAAATGDFAIHFVNAGTNAHEITMFEAPAEATIAEAQAALADVDGGELADIPEPFQLFDHITFAEPGEEADYVFAEPLPPGHYVIACYIPEGAHSEADFETATGKPHIQLGMIADFTVE
jgi:plastocyanin